MNSHKKILLLALTLLLIGTIGTVTQLGPNRFVFPGVLPAHATTASTCPFTTGATIPCLTVSLDPVSNPTKGPSTATCDTGLSGTVYTYGQYGLCDTVISPAASSVTTFRVGAILNTTGAATLANVFAWQFQLNYDPTILTPLGDPAMASDSGVTLCSGHPDCGIKTVNFGTQINDVTAGNSGTDWAKAVSLGPGTAGGGTGAISICENGTSGGVPNPACLGVHTGQILVGFTYVAPSVQIAAINAKTVLANVAFAIVSKAPAVITISNVSFRDSGSADLSVQPAPLTATCTVTTSCGQTTNTIGNNPPVASFTFAHTGTAYSFTDTSTDADPSDTFRYRIWDFGDGSSILNTTATTATHDYGMKGARSAPGLFNVTLRVVDNQGDTSAARDRNGLPIVNQAPQHTFSNLHLVELGSQPKFTFAPANPSSGTAVNFDASTSTYPDEPLLRGTAPVGGIALTSSNAGDATCLTISGLNCPVGFVDNNANGVFDPGVDTVVRSLDATGASVCNAGACDILAGPTITPAGQTIIADGKISWEDTNANGIIDPTEPIIYDTNGNSAYDGIKTYTWDFGDPTSGASNTATGITATHTFNPTATTTFTVKLTTVDNLSGTNSTTLGVQVTVAAVKHNTTTTVTCPSTAFLNQGVTCTATVTDSTAPVSTPTGTVTLAVGGVTGTFTTCSLAAGTTAGTATCHTTFSASTTGSASITGTYPGDTGHNASPQSAAAIVTVNLRTTTTRVTCAPSPVLINEGSTCTATVTDTAGGTVSTPTGTLTLGVSGVTGTFTTCNLTASTTAGTATCTSTFTASTSGTASIVGTYSGDSSHAGSSNTATPTSVGVNKRTTTVSVTCSPATIDIGQTTLCTASVTDSSTAGTAITPTGTATLNPPATGICTLAGTGATATCSATEASTPFPGTLMVTATFAGDTVHTGSGPSIAFSVTVHARTTNTIVSCPANGTVGTQFSCTVTVTDTDTGTGSTPTGTFTVNGVTCMLTGTGTSAMCTINITPTATGPLTVTANYPGDTTHATSTGSATVNISQPAAHPTTTTVSCTLTTTAIDQATSCTATVTDSTTTGATAPSGTVNFTPSGTCTLGTPTANSASCSVSITPTAAGPLTIMATYVPGTDTIHSASSGSTPITVVLRSTATGIGCDTQVVIGQTIGCTVTVTDTSQGTGSSPTGTVTLTPAGLTPCTLAATGAPTIATCTTTLTAPTGTGTVTVSASYPGDTIHVTSVAGSNAIVNVIKRTTSTTVVCTPSTITTSQTSSCKATVADSSPGTGTTPTGTVSWTASLGTFGTTTSCTLTSGSCSVTFSSTTTGSATITANYAGDTTHDVSVNTATVIVGNLHPTTTTVTCTPMTLDLGQTTSCAATVTDTSSTPTTPTGALTFLPSAFTCTLQGTTTMGVATCSFAVTPPTVGPFPITPTYPGDSTHATSTGSTSVTVNPRTTTTSISCTPSPVTVNTATTCTATITDNDAGTATTPTGTVTITSSGAGTIATSPCTLSGAGTRVTCQVTITPSGTAPRTDTITATYSGDASHGTSTNTFNLQVTAVVLHPTTTTVACAPSTVALGVPTTCTVTVTDTTSSGAITPTGTVAFTHGAASGTFNPSASCTLAGTAASASCSVDYIPQSYVLATDALPRSDSIIGTYSGDSGHSSSSNTATPATVSVTKRSTSTSLSCVPSSISTLETSSCSVVASDTSPQSPLGQVGMGGTITMAVTGASWSQCTSPCILSSLSGALTLVPTNPGTATVTATYSGDEVHLGSAGPDTTVTVTLPTTHTTTTTVSCSPNPVLAGVTSICTATVTDTSTSGATMPTGKITLSLATQYGGTLYGFCNLSGTGATATCTVPVALLVAFTSSIQASYPGDTTHSSSSGSTTLTATARPTATIVTCLPASVNSGTATTCTATVSDNSAVSPGLPSLAPTGTVGFTTSGTGTFATSPCTLVPSTTSLTASCSVMYTPTETTASTDTITATYVPDGAHSGSSNTATVNVTVQVVTHPTTTNISCNPSSIVVGQSSTCTATVSDTSTTSATVPTGTVTFNPGGPCTLQAATGPSAACSVPVMPINLALNPLPVIASYGGDSSHAGSPSNTVNLTVNARSTTTSLTCVPSPVSTGSQAICTISVTDTDVGGFIPPLGQVTVTSSGTGTFTGSPCTLTGTTATTTCQVTYTPGGTVPRTDTLTAIYAPATTHLASSGTFQLSIVTQVALTGGHAKLIGYRAAPLFRIQNLQLNATQTLFALGKNDGNITVNVYVLFSITTPGGTGMTLYTQVVQLSPSQVINGRDDTRFSVQFRPIPGTYTVTATIYYSPSSTTIGDPSFKPDNASAKTFTFTVLGAKLSGQGIHFQDELDAGDVQSFNAHVTNLSNKELLVRVDVSIRNPDETTSQITSASFLLNPGQTRNDITVKTSVLTVPGDYCLTASLKYGIVTNNDGILDDKKILGTSKTVHGCFEVKQNTSSGQSACDDEDDD